TASSNQTSRSSGKHLEGWNPAGRLRIDILAYRCSIPPRPHVRGNNRRARASGLHARGFVRGKRMSVRTMRVIGRHVLVYGVALIILLPFIWVLLSAFKSEAELLRYPPTLLPEKWTIQNFTQFFGA